MAKSLKASEAPSEVVGGASSGRVHDGSTVVGGAGFGRGHDDSAVFGGVGVGRVHDDSTDIRSLRVAEEIMGLVRSRFQRAPQFLVEAQESAIKNVLAEEGAYPVDDNF
jgi:hypothetical protein